MGGLRFKLGYFGGYHLGLFRCNVVQQTRFSRTELVQLKLRAVVQIVERFHGGHDLNLQGIEQAPQVHDFRNIVKIEAGPALAQDEAVGVIGDLAQARNVAVVLRLVDRTGELVVGLGLLGLVGEAVGVVELDQLFPECFEFVFFVVTQPLPRAHGGFGGSGSAVLNLPLGGSRTGLRLVGYGAREPGWVDTGSHRDSNVTDLMGARFALAVEPGGGWRIDLTGVAQFLDTRDSQYVYAAHARARTAQIAEPHDNDLRHIALRAERSAGPVTLVLSSGVTYHGIDDVLDATQGTGSFGLPDPRLFDDERRYRVLDSEVRAFGSSGSIRWLAGLSYVRAKQHGVQTLQGASGAVVTLDDDRRTAIDSAAFGDVTVSVFGSFDLNFGARFFRNSQHDARRLPGGMVKRETTRTGATPSAALSWHPRSGRLLFLRYGSALRQGGVNISQTGAPVFLKGDEFATIEAGWREERTGGARIELGVWHSWWEDVQSDLLLPNGLIETANAGNARILGAEASVSLPLDSGWKGEAGLNITSAMLSRSELGLRLNDRRLPVVPDYVIRGALSRAFAVGDGEASFKASLRYVGPARLSFDPVVDRRMGKVLESTFDAQFASGSWLWSASIDNIIGSSADTFAYGNPLRFALTRQRTPQRPRTVSLSLQRRF